MEFPCFNHNMDYFAQKYFLFCISWQPKASTYNSWFDKNEEDLTDPVRFNSLEEIQELNEALECFVGTVNNALVTFGEI